MINWLQGKKSYIVAILTALGALGGAISGEMSWVATAGTIAAALFGATGRAAISKLIAAVTVAVPPAAEPDSEFSTGG